jgi:hypothetical protein
VNAVYVQDYQHSPRLASEKMSRVSPPRVEGFATADDQRDESQRDMTRERNRFL